MENNSVMILLMAGILMFAVIGGLIAASSHYTLNQFKSRTVRNRSVCNGKGGSGNIQVCILRAGTVAEGRESAGGSRNRCGISETRKTDLGTGGLRGHPLSHDRRCRSRKDGKLSLPQYRICMCVRCEFCDDRYKRGSASKLCRDCEELLRIPDFCFGFEKSHAIRRK